jgi:iron complex outermembrane recepter protein
MRWPKWNASARDPSKNSISEDSIMASKLGRTLLTMLGVVGTVASQQGLAADTTAAAVEATRAAADATVLETVIVTAQKREEPLKDVPMSVTALGGERLDELQARDFADYAALVPGLSLASAQPGLTRLTLRGQNAGGVGSTVAVYFDESPFGSSTALLNGAVNTGDFDTYDMQRIEVLRGPQGTLYGANSEGGLLKFVTNAPVLGKFSAGGEVGWQSVDHGGQDGDVHGVLNMPLGDKTAIRVSGYYTGVPGYIDDPKSGASNLNDGYKYGGRASLLFQPATELSIRLTADTQSAYYNGTNEVDVNPLTLQPLYGELTQERVVAQPSDFKYGNYSATIDWNLNDVQLTSITSYGTLDTNQVVDATPLYGVYGSLLFGGTPNAPLGSSTNLNKISQELRVASGSKDRLEWQVGGYYTHESANLAQSIDAVAVPGGANLGNIVGLNLDSTYTETAGFADVTWHFNPQFDVQLGGRWSRNDQDSTQNTAYNPGFGIPVDVVHGSSNGSVWTYSLAPSWHFDANSMAYARLATGYRPGGPNALPPSAPPTVQREYGSDKTTNIELGVRSTQLDGRLSIDLAAFHVDWKDIQLYQVVDSIGINANGGTARSQGFEWAFGYLPVHGLTFQLTGAYTDAKLTSDAPDINASNGDPLPYAPKWTTSLDGQYEWAAFGDYKALVGATWSYVDSRSSDYSTYQASPPPAPAVQKELPSYNTWSLRFGLENAHYRFSVYGKNLSDEHGITNFNDAGSPYPTISVIQPRTFGITLAASF